MRIKIITTKLPSLDSGGPVRDFYLLKGLVEDKNNKIEIYYISQNKDIKNIEKLKRTFNIPIYTYIYSKNKLSNRILDYLLNKIPELEHMKRNKEQFSLLKDLTNTDIIQINQLDSYFSIYQIFDDLKGIKVLNAHNVDYLKYKIDVENKSIIHKLLVSLVINKFKKNEIETIKKFDHVITCSEIDKNYFETYISSKNISIIPNGVNSEYFRYEKNKKTGIVLFMGLLSYMPNLVSLKNYLKHIHPHIKNFSKEYKFHIIGANPPIWLKRMALKDKTIIVTGFVEDVRKYVYAAQICICPIVSASGTRLKILEYMACGKPVVSTQKGAEGLNIKNMKDIVIADNFYDFKEEIKKLINNIELCNVIGYNARKLVRKNYEWGNISENLNSLYKKMAR